MSEGKRILEEAGQRAALAAGKAALLRGIDDLTLSPEERAQRDAARGRARKVFAIKIALGGVVTVVLAIAAMSLFAQLWIYGIGLVAVLGVGGALVWWIRPKLAALKARAVSRLTARRHAEVQARAQLEAAHKERAAAEAAAVAQRRLDDQLAALKERAQRGDG